VLPILIELLKDDNADVKLKVVEGLVKISHVVGDDILSK
jgi:hypothetical protein